MSTLSLTWILFEDFGPQVAPLLEYKGKVAERDIVQFVEMRKFVSREGGWNKELLAKAVLAEIPGQVTGWMKMKGFVPKVMG